MAEKRNFWLKLNEHFFDEERIAYLLKQKGGEAAVIIYMKLLLKSLNNGGIWAILPGKQTEVRFIANALGVRPEKLRKSMEMLQNLELARWYPDGSFFMPGLLEMLGSEVASAARMRKKRALEASQANRDAGICDTDKDKDSESEINKDGEKDSDAEEMTLEEMERILSDFQ